MTKLKLIITEWLANLTRKLKNNFYLYLATLFTLLLFLDASILHVGENMRERSFDFMVKNRIFKANADKDIVIVDINEASLAEFSKEYGRWPWPRQVLGEFVENIQSQNPKAIVFDILFSDADIYNPDSDEYFNEIIADSENTFFPILRLDPSQDKLSQLKYAQIPGIESLVNSDHSATIAAILPHFEGALKAERLGTHNVYPDYDGIVREYRMFHDNAGWRLPALPLAVARFVGAPDTEDLPQNMLINWRGKPFSYTYASFSDVFTDLASKNKKRPQNEFADKIVIIGSTAPGLFDIKPTAMGKQFPGVEILATAIDNAKHGDYLKVWRGKIPYILLSLLLIWGTTFAFYFNVDRDRFNSLFARSQIGLLALSYFAINLTNTYLDLTAPIVWAVAVFGIAKAYALANDRALQRWLAFGAKSDSITTSILLLPILIESREPLGDGLLKKFKRSIEFVCASPNSIDFIHGTQSGIWGLFGDMVLVNWQYAEDHHDHASAAKQDAENVIAQLPTFSENLGLPKGIKMRYCIYEGKIGDGNSNITLASQWRTLFAQAVIKLEHGDD